jgi:hypothetical protein
MKGNPALPEGSLTSRPTWSNTPGCSATSAFFFLAATTPNGRDFWQIPDGDVLFHQGHQPDRRGERLWNGDSQRHQLSGAIGKRSRNRTGIAGNRQDPSARCQCSLLGDRDSGRNAVANHDLTARNLAMAVDGRRMRNGPERRFNSTSLTVGHPP